MRNQCTVCIFSAFFAVSTAAIASPSKSTHRQIAAIKSGGVKIVLHPTAAVLPDSNGFFTLADISDISGGTPEMREKLNAIEVGRAPIDSSYTRTLNSGDVALKLREAGLDPYRDVTLGGSDTTVVSTASLPSTAKPAVVTTAGQTTSTAAGQQPTAPAPPVIVIKNGDPITLVLQDGDLTVTADGEARGNGAVGDTIRVHRVGMVNDIEGQILDAHTVQLEL